MGKNCRLKNFPISFFSVILGLSGFTVAAIKAEEILNFPICLSTYFIYITIASFLTIGVFYILKFLKYKHLVIGEFRDPVKLNFFPTITISLLLLSIVFLEQNLIVSKTLWLVGAIFHFIFTLTIISTWINKKFEIHHINPAWFIPAVGNILIPVAGMQHASSEVSWFFFSIGFIFWIILLVIFFYRIIFHSPLPEKLLPTMFILIAPPAVGFTAYIKLTTTLDPFANILYYFSLFLTILLFFQIKTFQKIKFYLSWWAYSFPISAITTASILMYKLTDNQNFKTIAIILYIILIALIILLITKTAQAITRKEICVEGN